MTCPARYRLFDVRLLHKKMLSPSLMRCVFTGEQIRLMKMDGPDQRIKLFFPPVKGMAHVLNTAHCWREQIQRLPPAERPLLRTYTLRHVNTKAQQLEVEFVIHGTEGPASAWAINAVPGEKLQIVAPNRAHAPDSGGYEWKPPAGVKHALIIADETALPAVKNILQQMAEIHVPPKIQLFLEVPLQEDCPVLNDIGFSEQHWLVRDKLKSAHGEALLNAVKEHAFIPAYARLAHQACINDAEQRLLGCRTENKHHHFYGWVAAESSTVKHLRRYLSVERHVANEAISFMAYWCKRKKPTQAC